MSGSAALQHVVIRASAGTGKTYQLSNRFIGLLANSVPPEQILAATFTRKAAGEILDRVLLRLAQAATSDAQCQELAAAIGNLKLSRAKVRKLLVETARSLHRLRVGTLDSYFLQVAGGFSLELGLPPGWAICDELDDQRLRDEAIEQVLGRGKLPELLTLVHLLAKGAAIRGISRIVQDTVGDLFDLYRQAQPDAWEQLPTPKGLSAEQLAQAVEQLAEFPPPDKNYAKALQKDLIYIQTEDWNELISKGLAAKVLDDDLVYYKKPIPAPLVELYQRLLTHAKSVLVGQIARQNTATRELLERFAEQYYALQFERRAIRFGDVTQRLGMATGVNAPDRLAFRMDSAIRHLLLDEFQDTSPPQWQVLRPLAQSLTASQGTSFFCVGDVKQAIYGWRGGLAEIFDALPGELGPLADKALACSYRSSQPVIDGVNQTFQNLTRHPNLDWQAEPVAAWQNAFPPHATAKGDLSGYVRLEFAPDTKDDEDGTEVLFQYAAERVAQHVRQAPHSSVGVLVRRNEAVARMIYLLRKMDIPASEEGGNTLVDSPAVELILSLLRLADHPGDKVARFHLAESPLAAKLELASHQDAKSAAQLARRVRRKVLDEGYGPFVFAWARELAPFCDSRDLSRLQQLVEMAYEYQPDSTLRTDDLIALVEGTRVPDPAAAAVRVMTIHQAKGLEFDVVVLPELEGKLAGQTDTFVVGRPGPTQPVDVVCRYASEGVRKFFPPRLARLFEENREREVVESLCVLYVAMTRAVHCLEMILPPPADNEKSMPKTFAGLLRSAFQAEGPWPTSGIVYEHGDPRWYEHLPSSENPSAAAATSGATTIQFAPPPASRERGLERSSPSSLEGGQRVKVSKLLEPASQSFEQGTLVHAWLEHIDWLDAGLPTDEQLGAIAAERTPSIAADRADLARRIAEFRRQLTTPAVAAVLSRGAYQALGTDLQVQTERAFAIRQGDELLSGSIDRFVLVRQRGQLVAADVLDFKTDALSPGDAAAQAARIEYYQPQIAAYRSVVMRLTGLGESQVTARLVFLAAGAICPV